MMYSSPIISVIIPVYNVEKYLRECVESILAQTFTDYEIILVDDGSTDGSGNICDEYAAKYQWIKVIHKKNGGLSDARNAGLRFIKDKAGQYVTFIDSDDAVHPKYLEHLYKALKTTGADYAACPVVKGDVLGNIIWHDNEPVTTCCAVDEKHLLSLYKSSRIYWCVIPILIRKDIAINEPFTVGRIHEDNGLAFKWLYKAEKYAEVDTPLYFYRDTSGSIMNSPFTIKKLDYLWAIEEQLRFYKSVRYNEMFGIIAAHYAETAVWFSKRAVRELGDKKLSKKILKDADRLLKNQNAYAYVQAKDVDYIKKRVHKALYKLKHMHS